MPSADLKNGGAQASDWVQFGDAQTGQLDKSNDHYVSAVGIIQRCEARDTTAVTKATKKRFLGL